jgi:hypothetical protein
MRRRALTAEMEGPTELTKQDLLHEEEEEEVMMILMMKTIYHNLDNIY